MLDNHKVQFTSWKACCSPHQKQFSSSGPNSVFQCTFLLGRTVVANNMVRSANALPSMHDMSKACRCKEWPWTNDVPLAVITKYFTHKFHKNWQPQESCNELRHPREATRLLLQIPRKRQQGVPIRVPFWNSRTLEDAGVQALAMRQFRRNNVDLDAEGRQNTPRCKLSGEGRRWKILLPILPQ